MNHSNTLTHPRSSRRVSRLAALTIAVVAIALAASACGDDGASGSGGPRTVAITAPANNAQVGRSFDVQLAVNFPIGEPDTGRDHVHLYYDGNTADGEYGIAYADTFTVTGLAPGAHKIQAVVAHADHSTTDTRSEEITVEVTDGAGATDPVPTTGGSGFGY
jgi:hypothetical protein